MPEQPNGDLDKFLYPRGQYHGKFTPEKLAFNANLQEFGQQVSYLCGLATNGKISSEKAYRKIKQHWEALERSKKKLLGDT